MGVRFSEPTRRKTTVSERSKVGQWYSEQEIDELKQNVQLWDILELELSIQPPLYKAALVISPTGKDVQIAYCTPCSNDPGLLLSIGLLGEVIPDQRVRINNEIFGITNLLFEEDNDEAIPRFMSCVVAHFLQNTITFFMSSLVEEIRPFVDEQEDGLEENLAKPGVNSEVKLQDAIESELKSFIALIINFFIAGHDLQDKAEKNIGKVSNWFDRNHIEELKSNLCVGDILEFKRRCFYRQCGIYLGKLGDALLVAHFSNAGSGNQYLMNESSGLGSSAKNVPAYRIDLIEKPLGNHRVRINNRLDSKWLTLEPDDILNDIIELPGKQRFEEPPTYGVLRENCEHFVNELRHFEHLSEQLP